MKVKRTAAQRTTYWLVVEAPITPTITWVTWFNAIADRAGGRSEIVSCAQGRLGTGRQSDQGGPWGPMAENHLYPQCSLAFRVTSP